MRNEARKLTIFTTRNMRALLTTDDLDPVMAKLGFTTTVTHPSSPTSAGVSDVGGGAFIGWREYVFNGQWVRANSLNQRMPMAVLPHPRIDGLHESIYTEFIKAVEFYRRRDDVTEILHIRGLPLDRYLDRGKVWRSMEDAEIVVFVYREVSPMVELNSEDGRKKGTVGRKRKSNRIPARVFDEDNSEADQLVEYSDIVVQR